MSSGVALHSRLVISALTITLLPEPVAPAISRWGILARSTAIALPATSRPRANVSVEPDAAKSTSSRIRRRATTLNSLLGTSIPTALLPGIGASIRMLRAARAIERSSDRASIRLTLMCGGGLDLVLGHDRAGVAADDPGVDVEARELLDDDRLVPGVDRVRLAPAAGVGARQVEQLDRRQHAGVALARGGESRGVGDVVRVAEAAAVARPRRASRERPRVARLRRAAGERRRGGRRRLGRPYGSGRRSRLPAPDAGLARRVDAGRRAGLAPAPASATGAARPRPSARRASAAAAVAASAAAAMPVLERRAGRARGPGRGRQQGAEAAGRRRSAARDGERQQDHERAGRREQRLEQARPGTARSGRRVNSPRELGSLHQAEHADVGHPDAQQRAAPRRARILARAPLEVPARQQQHERQQPAPGAEVRHRRGSATSP